MDRPWLSVIIPVYREAARIAALLDHVAAIAPPGGAQAIVADGEPERSTLAALPENCGLPVLPLATQQGRARQMNAGAAAARGEVLLFLHADTRLPEDAFALIREALTDSGVAGGAFSLDIQPDAGRAGPGLACIARAANMRSRLTRAPYGDQAIFLRRAVFESMHGYADIPVMEDLELMTRLRRRGLAIRILPQAVRTSARRWEAEGLARCTGRNLLLRGLYHLGVRPERLAGLYK
ncbi:TIGR04283 family arsenosugar biosynthesis glycosyltransferase [Desulfocurvus vexinensis]|uniref:TIGR04283 family arsenosugar biosynthesis glycosyltransferase n=1 Tax=Desulfocurvus vexinensis TaxID=399548 RepID=UPI00048AD028|nr:TIGR04283 family arsenosugar biosynthesis glycosyltransferase [Desulfocurvus vexinensis]